MIRIVVAETWILKETKNFVHYTGFLQDL